jgi:hypothetical protein
MATLFQTACVSSGDWEAVVTDAACSLTFDTPTTGRMRASVDASTADSAWARKLGSSCTNFTLAIKGIKLVQHGGAAGASAAIVAQLMDGFSTYIEVQINSAGDLFCRNIAGSPIHNATINGTAVAVDDGAEHDLLIQGKVNDYFRYYVDGELVHESTGLSGGAAVDLERIAAGLIAVPTTWSGTDMIVEFDDITWTDQPDDDPYGWLTPGTAEASVNMTVTLSMEAEATYESIAASVSIAVSLAAAFAGAGFSPPSAGTRVVESNSRVVATWENDASYSTVVVRRSTLVTPASENSGIAVWTGSVTADQDTTITDRHVRNETRYFYAVYGSNGGAYTLIATFDATPHITWRIRRGRLVTR